MWPAPGMRARAAGAALCRIVLSMGVMSPDSEPPILPTSSPFYREGSWSRNLYRNQGQVRLVLQSWSRSSKPSLAPCFHLSIFSPCPQLSSFNAPQASAKAVFGSRSHFLALLMSKSLHLMKHSLGNLFSHLDEPENPSGVHRNP